MTPALAAPGQAPPPLWTRAFTALISMCFLVNCNMAVFFELHSHLEGLGLSLKWQGWIISIFALVGLLARPLITPFMTPGNGRRWAGAGCLGCAFLLLGYGLFSDPWPLLGLRALHGLAFVVMVSALTVILVATIPPTRSGEAFGLFGLAMVLPFAMAPPVAVVLSRALGGLPQVLSLTAVLMLLVLPLLLVIPAPSPAASAGSSPPGLAQLAQALGDRRVAWLLVLSLLAFTTMTPVFFFMESYAHGLGLGNAGLFFSLATGCEIASRLLFGRLFDRLPKPPLLCVCLGLLAASYLAMAAATNLGWLLVAAVGYGLGWGAAMPLFNAHLFDLSPPRLRAINANLGLLMFQAGSFLGPLAGAQVLRLWGFQALFAGCAVLVLASLFFLPLIGRAKPASPSTAS